jgi:trans-aconitate methyltransferase
MLPKDMIHKGPPGLAAWVRTTWMPYTQRVPERLRAAFIDEIVSRYVQDHPLDGQGDVHLRMVRLEVEAARPTA